MTQNPTTPKRETSVIIDPVAMNIVNKIALGTKSAGTIACSGGLLLQGEHRGELTVKDGPLVIYEGAVLFGSVEVHDDIYVFGQVGEPGDKLTELTSFGTVHLTSKAVVHGALRCVKLATYNGSQIHGSLETIQPPKDKA